MNRSALVLGLLFLSLPAFAQQEDSAYVKKDVSETDIQLLFSHYSQDGEHSAVTGGIGTEKLQVSAPDIYVVHTIDSTKSIYANFGVDVVTSASTDRIDFHVSSASGQDARWHLSLGYGQKVGNTGVEIGAKGLLSVESDYFSRGVDLWSNLSDKNRTRSASFRLQAFFDDLRWGRLSPRYKRPVKLIYPEELRYQEWDDRYDRTSLNASFGLTQVINKRLIVGFFPGIAYQYGLLSTPFHRVYFSDADQAKVEHLPDSRLKIPIGLQLNAFLGTAWIVRSYYRLYWDDFGILSHTENLELAFRVSPWVSITPFARYYSQSGAKYFQPFSEHLISDEYYTSDYDLSGFNSLEFGLGLRYSPFRSVLSNNLIFKEVSLRYGYYRRQDGLYSHTISTFFNLNVK